MNSEILLLWNRGFRMPTASLTTQIVAVVLAFLAPLQAVLISVFILIVCDTITGVWAAWKRGDEITSGKLKRAIPKVLVYNLSLLTAHLLGTYLIDFIPVVKIISALIGLVEGISLFENLYFIYPNAVIRRVVKILKREEAKLEDDTNHISR